MTFKKGMKNSGSNRMMFNHLAKRLSVDCSIKATNTMFSTAGGVRYITPGTYTFTVPASVYSLSIVCIGGGGGGSSDWYSKLVGGAGGGLGWKNLAVVPGQQYTVVVGAAGIGGDPNAANGVNGGAGTNGGDSYFGSPTLVKGGGGQAGVSNNTAIEATGAVGGTYVGDGGGNGGNSGTNPAGVCNAGSGAGGAGGYTGNGGQGCNVAASYTAYNGSPGTGGGGGGGGVGSGFTYLTTCGSGGGVGLFGLGANGAGGTGGTQLSGGGKGGSGGADGANGVGYNVTLTTKQPGGNYGGGGAGTSNNGGASGPYVGSPGGQGAVRIIWGSGRSFPTNAAITANETVV